MIGSVIIFIIVILVICSSGSEDTSNVPRKTHDEIYEQAPLEIKCKCMECNSIIYVPKQYLNDLTYRGPQTGKCPICDWKFRKVKIIQEWGLD